MTVVATEPIDALAAERQARALFEAFETGTAIAPPVESTPGLDAAGAYRVQAHLRSMHEAAGRRVVGRKVGLTSLAMQAQLGVGEPDSGLLFDTFVLEDGARLRPRAQRMIRPRLEAEIAFVLDRPLAGPGVSAAHVIAATRAVVPVFEVIDSRVVDWRITLPDTVADNASCFGAVLGTPASSSAGVDVAALDTIGLVLEHDGAVVHTAAGAAVLGHPARAVAWLANTLAAQGGTLAAGELILAGSLTAAVDLAPGWYRARFGGGIGSVEVRVDDEVEAR